MEWFLSVSTLCESGRAERTLHIRPFSWPDKISLLRINPFVWQKTFDFVLPLDPVNPFIQFRLLLHDVYTLVSGRALAMRRYSPPIISHSLLCNIYILSLIVKRFVDTNAGV